MSRPGIGQINPPEAGFVRCAPQATACADAYLAAGGLPKVTLPKVAS